MKWLVMGMATENYNISLDIKSLSGFSSFYKIEDVTFCDLKL